LGGLASLTSDIPPPWAAAPPSCPFYGGPDLIPGCRGGTQQWHPIGYRVPLFFAPALCLSGSAAAPAAERMELDRGARRLRWDT